MEKYQIQDREAGNVILSDLTLSEAIEELKKFEDDDRKQNIYVPNFYEIKKQSK